MSNINHIIDKIIEDAEKKAQDILQQEQEKSQGILAKAQKSADQKFEGILQEYQRECEEERTRFLATSDLEFRKEILAAKQEVLEEVFQGVYDQLIGLEDQEFLALAEKLLKEAITTGCEVVEPAQRDEKLIDQPFIEKVNKSLPNGKLTLSEKTAQLGEDRGFIVISGGIEIDCTMKNLVKQTKEQLETEVCQILFSGERV